MTNNNINNIDKLPETYTVSYFNESEWDKDLTPEEILKRNELAALEHQDRLLYGSQYGPGNSQSAEAATKKIASVALAASYFTPLAAITVPASVVAGGVSAGMIAHGIVNDDQETGVVGVQIAEVLFDAAAPGMDSNSEGRAVAAYAKIRQDVSGRK